MIELIELIALIEFDELVELAELVELVELVMMAELVELVEPVALVAFVASALVGGHCWGLTRHALVSLSCSAHNPSEDHHLASGECQKKGLLCSGKDSSAGMQLLLTSAHVYPSPTSQLHQSSIETARVGFEPAARRQ